jgi:hypothetical protein
LANRLAQATDYARKSFGNYIILESKYIPVRNERLYDQSAKKQSPDVFLMFLVRKGDTEAESLRAEICSNHRAPDILYYLEAGKYQKLKFRLRSSELRMEFYMDLLYDLCRPGNKFFGVYTRSKCLVAAKV